MLVPDLRPEAGRNESETDGRDDEREHETRERSTPVTPLTVNVARRRHTGF